MSIDYQTNAQVISSLLNLISEKSKEMEEESNKYLQEIEDVAQEFQGQKNLVLDFFEKRDRRLLIEFIEFCFSDIATHYEARKLTAYFHDSVMDLSTIDCCKPYFKPWEK